MDNLSGTELRRKVVWQDRFIQYTNGSLPRAPQRNGDVREVYKHDGSGKFSRKYGTSDILWKVDNPHVTEGVVVLFEDKKVPVKTPDAFSVWKQGSVAKALIVRLLLIGHNIVSVWRVVEEYNNVLYWLLAILNLFLIAEGIYVVSKRRGVDYKWWCPCFFFYLTATLPAVWLLQIKQHDQFVQQSIGPDTLSTTTGYIMTPRPTTTIVATTTTGSPTNATWFDFQANITSNATSGAFNVTSTPLPSGNNTSAAGIESLGPNFSLDTWIIIIQETLIYLIVFCRWLIPRGKVSREFLADLLLEFLAIASDIMELLAVFDEDEVRADLQLTYVVLAVWTASFVQFIPNLVHKRQFRHIKSPRIQNITRACGDKFVEVVVTCMGIFLQDGPFLIVRLYIMITLQLFTYSLVFFVLKNAVTLILLTYRLSVMTYRLPCCIKIRRKSEVASMFPHLKTEKAPSDADYA